MANLAVALQKRRDPRTSLRSLSEAHIVAFPFLRVDALRQGARASYRPPRETGMIGTLRFRHVTWSFIVTRPGCTHVPQVMNDPAIATAKSSAPVPTVASGTLRRVGVEIEFMGPSARVAAASVTRALGGSVHVEDPHAFRISGTRLATCGSRPTSVTCIPNATRASA